MSVVSYNKLNAYFMQKSCTDCAIHIVGIFGLKGEVFSQTPVNGHCIETLKIRNKTIPHKIFMTQKTYN